MKTPEQIAEQITNEQGYVSDGDLHTVSADRIRGMIATAIEADRAQRADEMQIPDPWETTLHILQGDGDEYTDTVNIRFTRSWDHDLTREHTVMWGTFVKALVVIAREEGEA